MSEAHSLSLDADTNSLVELRDAISGLAPLCEKRIDGGLDFSLSLDELFAVEVNESAAGAGHLVVRFKPSELLLCLLATARARNGDAGVVEADAAAAGHPETFSHSNSPAADLPIDSMEDTAAGSQTPAAASYSDMQEVVS